MPFQNNLSIRRGFTKASTYGFTFLPDDTYYLEISYLASFG